MLDEGVLGDKVLKCLARHKVVVDTVGFTLARWACSVFFFFFFETLGDYIPRLAVCVFRGGLFFEGRNEEKGVRE